MWIFNIIIKIILFDPHTKVDDLIATVTVMAEPEGSVPIMPPVIERDPHVSRFHPPDLVL
jgi:hypothetical protein